VLEKGVRELGFIFGKVRTGRVDCGRCDGGPGRIYFATDRIPTKYTDIIAKRIYPDCVAVRWYCATYDQDLHVHEKVLALDSGLIGHQRQFQVVTSSSCSAHRGLRCLVPYW